MVMAALPKKRLSNPMSDAEMTAFDNEKNHPVLLNQVEDVVPVANPAAPVLALDFDGVLHNYDGVWHDDDSIITGGLKAGAANFLYEAVQRYNIAIYSVRSATEAGRTAMKLWLVENLSEEIGDKATEIVEHMKFPEHKPFASLMIDDRAYRFEGQWPSIAAINDLMERPFAAE